MASGINNEFRDIPYQQVIDTADTEPSELQLVIHNQTSYSCLDRIFNQLQDSPNRWVSFQAVDPNTLKTKNYQVRLAVGEGVKPHIELRRNTVRCQFCRLFNERYDSRSADSTKYGLRDIFSKYQLSHERMSSDNTARAVKTFLIPDEADYVPSAPVKHADGYQSILRPSHAFTPEGNIEGTTEQDQLVAFDLDNTLSLNKCLPHRHDQGYYGLDRSLKEKLQQYRAQHPNSKIILVTASPKNGDIDNKLLAAGFTRDDFDECFIDVTDKGAQIHKAINTLAVNNAPLKEVVMFDDGVKVLKGAKKEYENKCTENSKQPVPFVSYHITSASLFSAGKELKTRRGGPVVTEAGQYRDSPCKEEYETTEKTLFDKMNSEEKHQHRMLTSRFEKINYG